MAEWMVSLNVLIQQKCGQLVAYPLIKVGDVVLSDATRAPACFAVKLSAFREVCVKKNSWMEADK